jgi:hypothetical protein
MVVYNSLHYSFFRSSHLPPLCYLLALIFPKAIFVGRAEKKTQTRSVTYFIGVVSSGMGSESGGRATKSMGRIEFWEDKGIVRINDIILNIIVFE